MKYTLTINSLAVYPILAALVEITQDLVCEGEQFMRSQWTNKNDILITIEC